MAEGTVHVIDDDAPFRDSLREMLGAKDYHVVEHTDGEGFADRLERYEHCCALVDVAMPGLDGLALQEMLNARGIRLPLIIVTGQADVAMAVRAMKAGAVDFIEKPFDARTLFSAIDAALARRPVSFGPIDAENAEFRRKLGALTDREREILDGVVAGHPTKVIATELGISPRTVDVHRARIGDKLVVSGLSKLVRLSLAAGVQPPDRWRFWSR